MVWPQKVKGRLQSDNSAALCLVMLNSGDKPIDGAKLLKFSFCCFPLSDKLVCLIEKWKLDITAAVVAWTVDLYWRQI